MRHHSFTLSRPGLKPGYDVPRRLRVVDTVTTLSGIPLFALTVAAVFLSVRVADHVGLGAVGKNPWAFFGYVLAVFYVASWGFCLSLVRVFRLLFRYLALMTEEESRYYPLRASKGRFDAWPDCWQEPIGAPGQRANEDESK